MRITTVPAILVGVLLLLPAAHAQQSITEWEAEGIALEKATGIPRLPLPKNIPSQEHPSRDLVHCTVAAPGRSGFVSIWLKKVDCDVWLKQAMEYNNKYGQALAQVKARRDVQRERAPMVTAAQNRPASQALGIQDIPQILAAQQTDFDQTYKGKRFTARMTVNDVVDRTTYISVGFNTDATEKMFPPISCYLEDLSEVVLARHGNALWVSGILSTLAGSTISLRPCQISLSQEPLTVPRPWKTHPPRQ